MLLVIVTLT